MSEREQIALQLGIVALVLLAAVYGILASARGEPPSITVASAGPDASLIASTVRSPSPSPPHPPSPPPAPTASPAPPSASPTPSPTRRPVAMRPYSFGGRTYTGVQLGQGWTVVAPLDGSVELHFYQLIDGQIREFTDAPGVAKYPYVIVNAADGRKLTYRPGALGRDTEVVAAEGPVRTGDALFRVIGEGPSSWRELYDPAVPFQVVVSAVSAADADLDAAPLVRVR